MRRKPVAVIVALLGVAVLLAAGVTFRTRMLEEWYVWQLESENLDTRKRAAEALGALGSPRVIEALVKADYRWVEERGLSEQLIEIKGALEASIDRRDELKAAFERLSPSQSEAVDVVKVRQSIAFVDNKVSTLLQRAERFLFQPFFDPMKRIAHRDPPAATLVLTDLLAHDEWWMRAHAVKLLGDLGPAAAPALAAIEALGDDPDAFVRLAAGKAAAAIPPPVPPAAPDS